MTYNDIKEMFPDKMLGDVVYKGLIVPIDTSLDSYSRYYSGIQFKSSDGIAFRFFKQWTKVNIGNIIKFAQEHDMDVQEIKFIEG